MIDVSFFFFNDTATTEIYSLSLHDALPICAARRRGRIRRRRLGRPAAARREHEQRGDRKSTRLNSSHSQISYAVFCLKKKNPPGFQCELERLPSGTTSHCLTLLRKRVRHES